MFISSIYISNERCTTGFSSNKTEIKKKKQRKKCLQIFHEICTFSCTRILLSVQQQPKHIHLQYTYTQKSTLRPYCMRYRLSAYTDNKTILKSKEIWNETISNNSRDRSNMLKRKNYWICIIIKTSFFFNEKKTHQNMRAYRKACHCSVTGALYRFQSNGVSSHIFYYIIRTQFITSIT